MNKLLIICGPTATGKTALGIKLARKISTKGGSASGWNGEIVSADSRQVYKYMNVGTGKDIGNSKFKIQNLKLQLKIKKELKQEISVGVFEIEQIPIWGLNLINPDQQFSVAQWRKFANLVIKDIWDRKKLPIIVGGTGFWIKALLERVDSIGIPPDCELRKKLSNLEIKKLAEILAEIHPERLRRMNESDRKNSRRLIRAIEIARAKKYRQIKVKEISQKKAITANCDILLIGLKAENKTLYERIDKRVEERVKMGAEKEIKGLLKKGHSFENSVLGATIGYKEWQLYLEKSRPKDDFNQRPTGRWPGPMAEKEEVVQKWKFSEHGYARRQITWFKGYKNIIWFDILKTGWQKNVVKLVVNWYTDSDGKN